jgi:hypothetical protein
VSGTLQDRLRNGVDRLLYTSPHVVAKRYGQIKERALAGNAVLAQALAGTTAPAGFSDSGLARQLPSVARVMAVAPTLGISRQTFFCSMGGFDTHTDQNTAQPVLLRTLHHAGPDPGRAGRQWPLCHRRPGVHGGMKAPAHSGDCESIRSVPDVARMERSGIRGPPRRHMRNQCVAAETWISLHSIQATGNRSAEYFHSLSSGVTHVPGAARRGGRWALILVADHCAKDRV